MLMPRHIDFMAMNEYKQVILSLRFEDSAVFETPPPGGTVTAGKGRHGQQKRDLFDPFAGLEKYGINTGHAVDEAGAQKKRKR